MKKPVSDSRKRTLVRQAIDHAEKAAVHDDRAYLAALPKFLRSAPAEPLS